MTYLGSVPLNLVDISQELLNIESKERSNLFQWNGQFSPQFVEEILRKYARPNSKILDPFCGSGTVLFEAAALGHSAVGIELNPAAFVLARTYILCNQPKQARLALLNEVELSLKKVFPVGWPSATATEKTISPRTKEKLLALCETAKEDKRAVIESLIILSDFFKDNDERRLAKFWLKLKKVVAELPYTAHVINALHGDGRFPAEGSKFDLVVTSPPYINVYNYHQQYRASAEALGWDLLEIAKTEVGSNRKHRGNRFLTVTQYCLDLATTLISLRSAVIDSGRLIFVLGKESRVRGVPFLNGEIAAQLAIEACGYRLVLRQERVFRNRFGQSIFEDIIHLEKHTEPPSDFISAARRIAKAHLRKALECTTDSGVMSGLLEAIEKISVVAPSPQFQPLSHSSSNKLEGQDAIPNASPRKAKRNSGERKVARGR